MAPENRSIFEDVGEDTWMEYRKHVIKELERLNTNYEHLLNEVITLKVDIGALNVKAGIWGLMGAAIPVSLMIIVEFLKK